MANKKTRVKKVKAIEIEKIEAPIIEEVIISEADQLKIQLKEIQQLLNGGYDTKNRSSLLQSQMELQIKLKNL